MLTSKPRLRRETPIVTKQRALERRCLECFFEPHCHYDECPILKKLRGHTSDDAECGFEDVVRHDIEKIAGLRKGPLTFDEAVYAKAHVTPKTAAAYLAVQHS